MNSRFLYLIFCIVICATLMMCKTFPDLNIAVNVPYPDDNPTDTAKIALGKKLFFDTRLSIDNTVSCASCHKPGFCFYGWAQNGVLE